MTRVGLWSVLGVLALAGTASAQAPAWCKGYESRDQPSWEDALKDDIYDAIPDIVGCVCTHKCGSSSDDWEKHGREVEQARQKWSQKLDMTDADWAEAVEWASGRHDKDYNVRGDNKSLALSSLGPVDQYSIILNANTGFSNKAMDQNYVADAFGPKLTESGRLAYILWCTGDSNHKEVQWAMCQPDIDALDTKKIASELRAETKHPAADKFIVRIGMHVVRGKLAEHAAEVKAAAGKDPAYGEMFKIAAKTRKEWDGLWKSEAALVDLALAMDDARATNSRRLFAGCDDKTWPALKAAISSIPAKQFASIDTNVETWKHSPRESAAEVIHANAKGYLAAMAHVICHSADEKSEKKDPVVRALGESLIFFPGFRGPRNATQMAIASAGLQLDDRSAKIEYPSVDRQWFSTGFGGSSGGGSGVVKSVKPQGELIHIEFNSVTTKEPRCVKYAYTHRLTGIDSSGRFTYESGCAKEEMVNVTHTASPVNVLKRYAEGVRAGMKLMATENAVDLVWPKSGTSTPNMVFGVPVK